MRRLRLLSVAVIVLGVLAQPAVAGAAVEFTTIRFDPPGTDTGTNAHLNEETVVIKNTGNRRVTLTGWTLRDADRHVYRFGTFRLRPGRAVTIHTGIGDDTRRHLFWGMDNYVWNNDGDTAILKDDGGNRVDRCRYPGGDSPATC